MFYFSSNSFVNEKHLERTKFIVPEKKLFTYVKFKKFDDY